MKEVYGKAIKPYLSYICPEQSALGGRASLFALRTKFKAAILRANNYVLRTPPLSGSVRHCGESAILYLLRPEAANCGPTPQSLKAAGQRRFR